MASQDATNIAIGEIIAEETAKLANNPNNSVENRDAPLIAGSITNAVLPVVLNATNNEPWYQSRVTWGVIIAGAATIAKPLIGEIGIDAAQSADLAVALATAGQAIGFALTLYGRWKARKPIGA